jgi:excisionase family DNA binding protein
MKDDHQRPDTTRPDRSDPDRAVSTARSLQEAAVWAGVNERTLRRWIKSGRLFAVKDDGQYRILVTDLERASHAAPSGDRMPDILGARASGPDTSDTVGAKARTADMSGPGTMSGIDLSPLADLIERQARELAEMREAAAVWQVRARQAEEQLKQLTAGPTETTPENAPMAQNRTERDVSVVRGIQAWWRRLWNG